MIRTQAYLDRTTHDLLTDYATKNDCSLSHAASKIITAFFMGDELESKRQLENKQRFLRLMNVLNQVLMCVYDSEKVTIESNSAKECLEHIKQSVIGLTTD